MTAYSKKNFQYSSKNLITKKSLKLIEDEISIKLKK